MPGTDIPHGVQRSYFTETERLARNGRDDLVRRHAAVAADRVPTHRKSTLRAKVRVLFDLEAGGMLDPEGKVPPPGSPFHHVPRHFDQVSRPHVAAAGRPA